MESRQLSNSELDDATGFLGTQLDTHMVAGMSKPFTKEEARIAIFKMKRYKRCGKAPESTVHALFWYAKVVSVWPASIFWDLNHGLAEMGLFMARFPVRASKIWFCPPFSELKLNSDATVSSRNVFMVVGAVIRNDTYSMVATLSKLIYGDFPVESAADPIFNDIKVMFGDVGVVSRQHIL
ncbi:hypothetical protein ACOSP7_028132 [Xanthoceras sorbifolium]